MKVRAARRGFRQAVQLSISANRDRQVPDPIPALCASHGQKSMHRAAPWDPESREGRL